MPERFRGSRCSPAQLPPLVSRLKGGCGGVYWHHRDRARGMNLAGLTRLVRSTPRSALRGARVRVTLNEAATGECT
jgi:hypothetical protein